MEMSRSSAGLWGLAVTAATVVVMVLLAVFGVVGWGVAAGLIAAVVFTLALLYILFGRLNNIQKTGYASLLGVVLIALFIPLFWLGQNSSQASFASSTYDLNLHRGAALYGTYCLTCHGSTGQGYNGPPLNVPANAKNPTVNNLTDDDITRIISAGVPKNTSDLTNQGLAMPAWSDLYGGPLTSDDISYLVALIRSADPMYLQTNHISDMTDGFSYVYGELTTQAEIDNYNKYLHPPAEFGAPVDMTKTNQVTMNIIDTNTNSSGYDFQYLNIQIKAGTTVTWVNTSSAIHTVTSGPSGSPTHVFDSGTNYLQPNNQGAGSTFSFKFTTPGTYPYYCAVHPSMVAQIIVVP